MPRPDPSDRPAWTDRIENPYLHGIYAPTGHETTAVALSWGWYLLGRHPHWEARLHSEVDAVLGGRAPEHADLARLPETRSGNATLSNAERC